MYLLQTDTADQNDVTAYLDSAVYDAMAVRLKRKGSGVLVLICDQADDSAVAVSKTVFEYGRKAKLKFAVAIAELSTGRVYFLGNEPTKCQQMIANFVMNCDLPIKEKYIVKTKLPFQTELQEKLDHFTYRDFKEGNFLSE